MTVSVIFDKIEPKLEFRSGLIAGTERNKDEELNVNSSYKVPVSGRCFYRREAARPP